jgi:hypothetical protein
MRASARLHAHLEEKFIHTVLSQRVPGGARHVEEDHRVVRQEFDDVITQFDSARAYHAEDTEIEEVL